MVHKGIYKKWIYPNEENYNYDDVVVDNDNDAAAEDAAADDVDGEDHSKHMAEAADATLQALQVPNAVS